MELARAQQLLARLATDSRFRQTYQGELDSAQVEAFAATLLRKRLGAVRKLLPRSSRAWGPRFGELFRQYAGTLHCDPLDDARGFAAMLAALPDPAAHISRDELRQMRWGKAAQFFRALFPRPLK